MIDMANLALTQPNVSTSHLKKMAQGSPATVTVALTLASTSDMTSSVYVFCVIHAVLTSLALSVNVLHLVIIYVLVCVLISRLVMTGGSDEETISLSGSTQLTRALEGVSECNTVKQ